MSIGRRLAWLKEQLGRKAVCGREGKADSCMPQSIDDLQHDPARCRQAAQRLFLAFATEGIHGSKEMPEDALPSGMVRGSPDHVLFITLTVSVDYQRDASVLWAAARDAFSDPGGHPRRARSST